MLAIKYSCSGSCALSDSAITHLVSKTYQAKTDSATIIHLGGPQLRPSLRIRALGLPRALGLGARPQGRAYNQAQTNLVGVASMLHSIHSRSLLTDLKSSYLIVDPLKSPGPLLVAYYTTLSSLLDKHAPIVTKLSRPPSPSNPQTFPSLRVLTHPAPCRKPMKTHPLCR